MSADPRAQRAWCLYDWANSAFATTVMAAVLPPYFASLAGHSLPPHQVTALWGYATSGFLLLAALVSPLIGAAVDHARAPRLGLALTVGLGCAGTAALALPGPGQWGWLLAAYGVGFLGFSASTVIYDGLLLAVASPGERDRVSARGFAWGYAGGGVLLTLHAVLIARPELAGLPDTGAAARLALASVALWWAGFSVPLILRAPVPPPGLGEGLRHPWARLRSTWATAGRLREAWKFLAAFWLYNDAVGTVVKMSAIYGAALGFGTSHLVGALVLVQFLALPATLAAARLARRVGPRPVVLAGLGVYLVIGVLGFFMTEPLHFWILAALVATAQGGVQSLSRSLYARLVPAERAAEMFGYYSVSQKAAGLFGPLAFAVVSQVTGDPRWGALTIVPFLLAGGWVLTRVRLAPARET